MKLPEDPFVRELLPEFVDTWIIDIAEQFQPLLQAKNADDMYRLGHTIKGSCYQFGLDDIAVLGIELMGYCKANDWENIAQMEPRITTIFKEAQDMLNEAMN